MTTGPPPPPLPSSSSGDNEMPGPQTKPSTGPIIWTSPNDPEVQGDIKGKWSEKIIWEDQLGWRYKLKKWNEEIKWAKDDGD